MSRSGGSDAREPWFVSAFRHDYLQVYPHRDLEAARSEVAWLVDSGAAPRQGAVLDLACGFGRHSLALLEAGVSVVGIDLSEDLLERSLTLPGYGPLRGRLARADVRALPFPDGCFAGLLNLFSSFGYFGEEGDRGVMGEIARVLAPGGTALFDLMNPPRIRATLVAESSSRRGDLVLRERRQLEDDGARVTKAVELEHPDGRVERWREDVRMYEAEEFDPLCREHGLEPVRRWGDFAGSAYESGSERQILLPRRG